MTADDLWVGRESYTDAAKRWLQATDHYLGKAPPGALYTIVVRPQGLQLLPGVERPDGPRLGMCVIGRPVAPKLPQDGSWGEVIRMWLAPGLPHGTASRVLRVAASYARARDMECLIAYHDRTRHTGCIYKKAGFRKDGTSLYTGQLGWGSREGRQSATNPATPKRRWRLDLQGTA